MCLRNDKNFQKIIFALIHEKYFAEEPLIIDAIASSFIALVNVDYTPKWEKMASSVRTSKLEKSIARRKQITEYSYGKSYCFHN